MYRRFCGSGLGEFVIFDFVMEKYKELDDPIQEVYRIRESIMWEVRQMKQTVEATRYNIK